MSWFVLISISLAIAGITLWLNARFNVREKELKQREQQFNQQENDLKQQQERHEANLTERLKAAQSQEEALKERKTELDNFAKWLKSEDLRMQKKYDDMQAKIKAAFEERDSARQRAKRLHEEVKALKTKTKSNSQSGDFITP